MHLKAGNIWNRHWSTLISMSYMEEALRSIYGCGSKHGALNHGRLTKIISGGGCVPINPEST